MEVTTIVGIIIAILFMIFGLRMILKKSTPAEPSLESALHIDPESNQPIIPRHVRDQLPAETLSQNERKESELQDIPVKIEQDDKNLAIQAEAQDKPSQLANTPTESAALEHEVQVVEPKATTSEAVTAETDTNEFKTPIIAQTTVADAEPVKKADEFQLNPEIETAKISEFEGESSLLDVHLHEQQRFDDESALATAHDIVALNVYPNPRRALSGDKTLKVLLKYGLRYGEMSCFHRYEETNELSPLMFSVLRMTDNGPAGFDLETLSTEQVQGLAFFLALPHHDGLKGFDMMTSIAGLIAREIEGKVYDENNLELTPQLKEHWRHHVIDYRATQETV